jgi:hypothetical protein
MNSDEDGINDTPEKRACKPFRAPRKRVARTLPVDSPEKQPERRPRPFPASFGPSQTSSQRPPASTTPPFNPVHASQAGNLPESDPAKEVYYDAFDPVDDFDEVAASNTRFTSSQVPNQEDRRHAEEENWAAIRPESQRRFVESFHAREQFLQSQLGASQSFWQQRVEQGPESCS